MVEQIVEMVEQMLRDVVKAQAETRVKLDHYMKKVSGGSKAMDHGMEVSGGSKAMDHCMEVSGGSKAMDHGMKVSGGSKAMDHCMEVSGGSTAMDHCMEVSGDSKAMDHCMKVSGGSKAMDHCMEVFGGSKAMDHCMEVSGGSKATPAEIPADITLPLNNVAEVDALEMFVDLRLHECIMSATSSTVIFSTAQNLSLTCICPAD